MELSLHNKIFGTGSCLSEEQLLKYNSNALSQKEKHRVEKHLLECELCADALEGFTLVPASSATNEVRNNIQRLTSGGKIVSINYWRRILVAASVIGIVFISYFFLFRKNGIVERRMISENIKQEQIHQINTQSSSGKDNTIVPESGLEPARPAAEEPLNKLAETATKNTPGQVGDKITVSKTDKLNASRSQGISEIITNTVVMDEEIAATSDASTDGFAMVHPVEKAKVQQDSDELTAKDNKDNQRSNSAGYAAEMKPASAAEAMGKSGEEESRYRAIGGNVPVEEKKRKESEAASRKSAPAKKAEAPASGVKDIGNYKVIDYNYQLADAEPVLEKNGETKSGSLPAQFENEDKAKEVKAEEQTQVKTVPYEEVLRQAFENIDNGNYAQALEKFNLILHNYPGDLNAVFYSGLVYYNLGNYDKAMLNFNQVTAAGNNHLFDESNWYKALTYQKKNENEKARHLFRTISKKDNFYQKQAVRKLEEMGK